MIRYKSTTHAELQMGQLTTYDIVLLERFHRVQLRDQRELTSGRFGDVECDPLQVDDRGFIIDPSQEIKVRRRSTYHASRSVSGK
jgi:hypothetical protein